MTDIGPGRGSKPRYLGRALTEAERAKVYRARKAGKPVPVLDPYAELRELVKLCDENPYDDNPPNLLIEAVRRLLEKYKC